MSVAVYIELSGKEVKKSSIEAIVFGAQLAQKLGKSAVGIAIGEVSETDLKQAGAYGLSEVFLMKKNIEVQSVLSSLVAQIVKEKQVTHLVFGKSSLADAISASLAVKLRLPLVNNIVELPEIGDSMVCKTSIYTGKAFAMVTTSKTQGILVVKKNAVAIGAPTGNTALRVMDVGPVDAVGNFTIKEEVKATGDVLLTEAEIVVSGGRGLKGPENWHIIESLAKGLGAATGCSKPVSDMDWRPHHEHVGQTGVKVAPSIYIAVGISGAIQHLAGVNSSKVIVVINKDPEAPFFKAADYGIVGDAFEILPKLTASIPK